LSLIAALRLTERPGLSGPSEFDLSAAWLRKAQGDLKPFMEAFAARMQGAVPERVSVERKRDGFFAKTSHTVKVTVEGEQAVYILALDRMRLTARRAKVVRGVTLRSDEMAVPDWLAALNGEMQSLAERGVSARNVIHDFLMS
jgi:hypothetical protein